MKSARHSSWKYLLALFSAIGMLQAEESSDPEKRFKELTELAESIRPDSNADEVRELFGQPLTRHGSGIEHFRSEGWVYQDFATEKEHFGFSVRIGSDGVTRVTAQRTLRSEYVDGAVESTLEGNVIAVWSTGSHGGFICTVLGDDGESNSVVVFQRVLVTGAPIVGARVRIRHCGDGKLFVFKGTYSLALISMEFDNAALDAGLRQPTIRREGFAAFIDPRQPAGGFSKLYHAGEPAEKAANISNSLLIFGWFPTPEGEFDLYQISGLDGYHSLEHVERFLEAFYHRDEKDEKPAQGSETNVIIAGNNWGAGTALHPKLKELSAQYKFDVYSIGGWAFRSAILIDEPAHRIARILQAHKGALAEAEER